MRSLTILAAWLALAPAAAPAQSIELTFEQLSGPAVRVTVHCSGEDDGSTTVSLSEEWGGIEGSGDEIHALAATDRVGTPLAVGRTSGHQWTIDHPPAEPLSLVYELRPEVRESLPPGHNDYRNVVRADLFHAIGNHALLLPEAVVGAVDVSVRWVGFEGWTIASSLGAGDSQAGRMALDDFRSGFFIGGEPSVLRLTTRPLADNTVGVAVIDADWGFDDERFLELVMQVVSAEREFFGDHTDPWFLVALTPNGGRAGEQGFSFGGTGLTNCFALFCNTGMDLSPGGRHTADVLRLLAHEYFHTWNGRKIRIDAPEGSAYWVSEGFTDFYARRLLRRAGLIDDDQHLRSLNEAIAAYDGNPERNAPNSRILEDFWSDVDISGLPYRRGDLLALAIDEAILAASGGSRSLDDVMRELYERSARGEPPMTPEQLFDLVASETAPDFGASVRRCALDGADPPLPETIENGSLRLSSGGMRVSDDGFDVAASRAAGVVVGVREQTGAHEAGLRDGMRLVSVERLPPVAGPSRLKVVTAEGEGSEATRVFEAVSAPRTVRRYAPTGG